MVKIVVVRLCGIFGTTISTGYNNHVLCHVVLDILVVSIFEHEHHEITYEVFDDIMRGLFNAKGSAKPNMSRWVTLVVD